MVGSRIERGAGSGYQLKRPKKSKKIEQERLHSGIQEARYCLRTAMLFRAKSRLSTWSWGRKRCHSFVFGAKVGRQDLAADLEDSIGSIMTFQFFDLVVALSLCDVRGQKILNAYGAGFSQPTLRSCSIP